MEIVVSFMSFVQGFVPLHASDRITRVTRVALSTLDLCDQVSLCGTDFCLLVLFVPTEVPRSTGQGAETCAV